MEHVVKWVTLLDASLEHVSFCGCPSKTATDSKYTLLSDKHSI